MRILFIGGTGRISMAITNALSKRADVELYLINRGNRMDELPENVKSIIGDINDEEKIAAEIKDLEFDSVADFIAFTVEDVQRDIRLFSGKTKQYIFISSASAYLKPCENHIITEDTPLGNPYWEYSRNKISCEELLRRELEENNFPATIVRPSHTYDNRSIPVGIHGNAGSFQVIERVRRGEPIIVHGDGESIWTVTYNEDFAKGFIGLLGNEKTIGETYHITTDECHTWNQIYKTIAKVCGGEYKPCYLTSQYLADLDVYDLRGSLLGDKTNSVIFDNSKIKAVVPDFVCTTTLEQGIKKAYDNIMANPSFQVEDPEFDEWCDQLVASLKKE